MAQNYMYIDDLSKSIDNLKENIDLVQAQFEIARKEDDTAYLTKVTTVLDKLNMIRCASDALHTKISQPLITRDRKGRESNDRDSGCHSVDSAALRSRDSSILGDCNRLSTLGIEESNACTDNSHLQCPSNTQNVLNPLPETKDAVENICIQTTTSDDENI